MTARGLYKRLVFPWLGPMTMWYLRKPRIYRKEGLSISVLPGVFHPGLFISTGVLLDFLKQRDLSGLRVLELGAGSGFLSVYASKQGTQVTATDISSQAVAGIRKNASANDVSVEIIQSDLFERIPRQEFDLVLINPPYYPREPMNESEHAWYCGTEHEYFQRLFTQLSERIDQLGEVVMILSEDCRLETIQSMAEKAGLTLTRFHSVRKWAERNDLFHIQSKPASS